MIQTILKHAYGSRQNSKAACLPPSLAMTLAEACECLLIVLRDISTASVPINFLSIAAEGSRSLVQVMVNVGQQGHELRGNRSHW